MPRDELLQDAEDHGLSAAMAVLQPPDPGRNMGEAGFLREETQDFRLRVRPFFDVPVNLEQEPVVVDEGAVALFGGNDPGGERLRPSLRQLPEQPPLHPDQFALAAVHLPAPGDQIEHQFAEIFVVYRVAQRPLLLSPR